MAATLGANNEDEAEEANEQAGAGGSSSFCAGGWAVLLGANGLGTNEGNSQQEPPARKLPYLTSISSFPLPNLGPVAQNFLAC